MFNKNLVLLRGLPGAGKSSLAQVLSENGKYPIFSIDDYFTNPQTGVYTFNFSENHLAYKLCITNAENAMQNHVSKIFIHNTFTLGWELEPYFEIAKKYHYTIHIITVEKYHNHKNIHEISDVQLKKMAEKYQVKLL